MASLRAAVARAEDAPAREIPCEALRRILIQAGELEQAACDGPSSLGAREECRVTLRSFRTATSLAASAFHIVCEAAGGVEDRSRLVRDALARMRRALDRALGSGCLSGRVWVKASKGFASDALFPERYREAASRWAAEHANSTKRDVLVVGIRSIGTTLSAVVAATLRGRGFRARRMTVRPKGHPFDRYVRLSKVRPADWALIVDEGPGPSGSSVLAVADALASAGMGGIHLFPGHDLGPGAMASEKKRARWREFPSYSSSLDALELGGLPLAEALWKSLGATSGDLLTRVVPCGNGAWRELHDWDRSAWPAVCRTFERAKFLCEGISGRRILFKFAGLATAPGMRASAAEVLALRVARLSREGLTAVPLGTAHGFVATEWLDGRPLDVSCASPALLRRIGGYIAAASGPPLSGGAARAARTRLETMLCVNVREALGDDAAGAALSLIRPVPVLDSTPRCGDGRLAPHEWIATRDGRVLKTDAGGHDLDQTWSGRQPVFWDLAGAILEWNLDESGERFLLDGFVARGGGRCAPLVLGAYGVAYAAHRAGLMKVGLDLETDLEERARLGKEYERWRERLDLLLGAQSRAGALSLRGEEARSR